MSGEKTGDYVKMLADELLPYLQEHYRISGDAGQRAVRDYARGASVPARLILGLPGEVGQAGGRAGPPPRG